MERNDREQVLSSFLKEHGETVKNRISIPADMRSLVAPEDVMQEAFVDAFLAIDGMPTDDAGFVRWLHTIATNNLRDAIRVSRAMKRGGANRKVGATSAVQRLPGRLDSPSSGPRRAERAELLQKAADSLPEPYRSAAVALLEDEPIATLAESLGKSRGVTYVVLGRTRKLLGQALRQHRSELFSRGQ